MTVPPVGFLGAGKMATALARGWISAGLLTPERILASDPLPEAREAFQSEVKTRALADNHRIVDKSLVLVLAVKPQTLADVLSEIRPLLKPHHLVVSIVAGATLAKLAASLGSDTRIVRVMPNTPSLVGACAAAFSPGSAATPDDERLVETMFRAVGMAFKLPEKLLDAVTGLSGSGPAFVAVIIEAMADGGVRMGLPRDVAASLAAQTVLGTARMVLEAKLHPALLKDMVASPGGTTIAGLHALERGAVRVALMDAVEAATLRAEALGKIAGPP